MPSDPSPPPQPSFGHSFMTFLCTATQTKNAPVETTQRKAQWDNCFPHSGPETPQGTPLALLAARAHCQLRFKLSATTTPRSLPFGRDDLQPLAPPLCTYSQGCRIPGAERSACSSSCRWGPPSHFSTSCCKASQPPRQSTFLPASQQPQTYFIQRPHLEWNQQ